MSTWYMRSMPNGMIRWKPGLGEAVVLAQPLDRPRCVGRTMRMPERIPTTMRNDDDDDDDECCPAHADPFRVRAAGGRRPPARTMKFTVR